VSLLLFHTDTDAVQGVTQLHDDVFVICEWSSTILTFNAITHQRTQLPEIRKVHESLRWPFDIAACEKASRLYLVDSGFVWRIMDMSTGSASIERWMPKTASAEFSPYTLSVTSTRLLVTSREPARLTQFDADGKKLISVQLPDYMEPHQAVESPSGTFVVSYYNTETTLDQISQVNQKGEVIDDEKSINESRRIDPVPYVAGESEAHNRRRSLGLPSHVAVDSRGNIFVADTEKHCILLLDAELTLRRVIVDEHQLNYDQPLRLCYVERTGQLLVALKKSVAVFDVCRH